MDELIVNTLDELEELYTRHMITYSQYVNIKEKLKEKEDSDE